MRLLAEPLAASLGQPVVIENRPGANGVLGAEVVSRASPNGEVFLLVTNTHVANRYTMASLPFDPVKDFTPVGLVARFPFVLVVPARSPFQDVAGLVAGARANPGSLNFGVADTVAFFAGHLFARRAGLQMSEVPYRGSGQVVTDVIAGNLPLAWASAAAVLPHLAGGSLRPLAVTGSARSAAMPEVPTVAESGLAGYEVFGWYGAFGPPRLPAEFAQTLQAALAEAAERPTVRERLLAAGTEVEPLAPAAFVRLLQDDSERWANAAREGLLPRA